MIARRRIKALKYVVLAVIPVLQAIEIVFPTRISNNNQGISPHNKAATYHSLSSILDLINQMQQRVVQQQVPDNVSHGDHPILHVQLMRSISMARIHLLLLPTRHLNQRTQWVITICSNQPRQ